MPKSSVKSNNNHHHHHRHLTNNHHQQPNHNSNHNSNLINSPDSSQQCNNGNGNNTSNLQNKDASKRLKRKLRLQEMRCNLMSTKMTELKTALSTKKRQLRVSEKKAKDEEKKRRDEEKKMKDMEKEFHRLRKENDQIKENLTRNQNVNAKSSITATTTPIVSQLQQQKQQQPQASTSHSSSNNNTNTSSQSSFSTNLLAGTSSVPNSSNKNKNNKQNKRMAALADNSPQVQGQTSKSSANNLPIPMIIGTNSVENSKKTSTGTPSKPSTSEDLRINEGASCSGINNSAIICSDASKDNVTKNDVGFFGTSKLEDLFENELMCAICHELYIKPVALSCSHIFCSFCIEQWRKKAHRCPICRNMILDKSPQNVLENVIDKVVSTMDEDSKKRRSDVIKDRPISIEPNRFSRNDGSRRDRIIMNLGNDWRNLAEYVDRSDSYSDSDSYIPSFYIPSALPANGTFQSDSDLDFDSDMDQEHYFSRINYIDPHGYDTEEYDDQDDSGSDDDDEDNEDNDDTEDVEYTTDESDIYGFADGLGENYNFDHDSSVSSWEADHSWQSSGHNSPIIIDSDGNSFTESIDYNRNYDDDDSIYTLDHDDQEEDDDDEEEDEEEDEEDDDEEQGFDHGIESEEEEEEEDEEDVDEEEGDEDNDDEDEDKDEDEDEDDDDDDDESGDGSLLVPATDSDPDDSVNGSPWESMDMTESDSDL